MIDDQLTYLEVALLQSKTPIRFLVILDWSASGGFRKVNKTIGQV